MDFNQQQLIATEKKTEELNIEFRRATMGKDEYSGISEEEKKELKAQIKEELKKLEDKEKYWQDLVKTTAEAEVNARALKRLKVDDAMDVDEEYEIKGIFCLK